MKGKTLKILLLSVLGFSFAFAQGGNKFAWNELLMQKYNNTWFYTSSRVEPPNAIAAFVPFGGQAALDGNIATCWAEGVYGPGIGEEIWFSVPDNIAFLDVVNGYMRSERNYKMSNRVGKLSIRLFLGIYVEGRDAGGERRFYVTPLTEPMLHKLEDNGNTQRLSIDYPYRQTVKKRAEAEKAFTGNWKGLKVPKSILFAKLRILSVFPGTLYDDTSISEIKTGREDLSKKILRVYVNDNGDTLKVETPVSSGKVIAGEKGAIFLLQEQSSDLKWAIVLILGNEKNGGKARYVLYYLPTATRFETYRIDKDCEEITRFSKERNQLYLIYQKKGDINSHSILLRDLIE